MLSFSPGECISEVLLVEAGITNGPPLLTKSTCFHPSPPYLIFLSHPLSFAVRITIVGMVVVKLEEVGTKPERKKLMKVINPKWFPTLQENQRRHTGALVKGRSRNEEKVMVFIMCPQRRKQG